MAKSVEAIKVASRYLRGTVFEDLYNNPESGLNADNQQLVKFFGMYQQENRDRRRERKLSQQSPEWSFMVRVATPGGDISAAQYLAIMNLLETIGEGHLRLTSRQAVQVHGVTKKDLTTLVQSVSTLGMTSLGGCGDVVRNVMSCPLPDHGGPRDHLRDIVRRLAMKFRPESTAYLELFVDQQKVFQVDSEVEPLYGDAYLPRKFKIGFAISGDNCTDIYTHDIGVVAHVDPDGSIGRFSLLVGGGLGHSHGVKATRPFLAQRLGDVQPPQLEAVLEAIITIQRDYGNRSERKFARMKYLVHEWGLEAFRAEVERRAAVVLEPSGTLIWNSPDDHLGFHALKGGDGSLGLLIPQGRIAADVKAALWHIATRFRLDMRITSQQNLLLLGVNETIHNELKEIFIRYGVLDKLWADQMFALERLGMACVALPTCGLALAEAERVFPPLREAIFAAWTAAGFETEPLIVRMTGCPNNCVRSEMAEIGFVGSGPSKYHIYLGGSRVGDRLAELFLERVEYSDLASYIRTLIEWYACTRIDQETFGDWVIRKGVTVLRQYVQEVRS